MMHNMFHLTVDYRKRVGKNLIAVRYFGKCSECHDKKIPVSVQVKGSAAVSWNGKPADFEKIYPDKIVLDCNFRKGDYISVKSL